MEFCIFQNEQTRVKTIAESTFIPRSLVSLVKNLVHSRANPSPPATGIFILVRARESERFTYVRMYVRLVLSFVRSLCSRETAGLVRMHYRVEERAGNEGETKVFQ